MNRYQNNKMDSYRAALALLVNTTETNAIPGFAAKRTAFGDKVDAIGELIAHQAKATAGKVAERDRVFDEMMAAVLALAGVLRSHAAGNGLSDLLATVWINAKDFKIRHADKVVLAQSIVDAARSRLAELAPFEITAASLADVQAMVDAAQAVLSLPRSAIADRKAATERLAVAFHEADAFLKLELNPLLLPLKKKNPLFYATYQARSLVKRPGFRAAEAEEANEAETTETETTTATAKATTAGNGANKLAA